MRSKFVETENNIKKRLHTILNEQNSFQKVKQESTKTNISRTRKRTNDFSSFNFGDIQLMDIMKFLGGATTLDSFLKIYKDGEMKG